MVKCAIIKQASIAMAVYFCHALKRILFGNTLA